jgi:hypothetical protein
MAKEQQGRVSTQHWIGRERADRRMRAATCHVWHCGAALTCERVYVSWIAALDHQVCEPAGQLQMTGIGSEHRSMPRRRCRRRFNRAALLGLTTKSHIHASTTGTRRDPPSSKRPEVVTLYTTAKIMAFPAKYASRNTNDGCKTNRERMKVA